MGAPKILTIEQAKSLLSEVVQHTFESLLFVEAVPVAASEAAKIDGADGLEVSIDIKSDYSGRIRMSLSRESARRLASLGVGLGGETSDEGLADLHAEILNTIGGRVAAQQPHAFDLSIPTASFGKLSTAAPAPIKSCFQIEYGIVCFDFHLETGL